IPVALTIMLCALLLVLSAPVFKTAQLGCVLPNLNVEGYSKDGDIIIGGIFPLHYSKILPDLSFTKLPKIVTCEMFKFRTYRWLQSMVFAIEEINSNKNLLPNITLGFEIYDSCNIVARAIMGSMWMVTGQGEPVPNYHCQAGSPLAAVVGDGASQASIPIARLLGLYSYPQISYGSSVALLSDKREFPSFFRTIPNDNFQSLGLARLVMSFGWTWVGLLAEDNEYGQQGIQILKQEIITAGGCISFFENIPVFYSKEIISKIVIVIKNSKANAIVVFSNEPNLIPLLEEVTNQNITGKVWIASEGWSLSSVFFRKKFLRTLSGSIGIMTHKGEIPGFQEFLYNVHPSTYPNDIFIEEFWENAFDCKWHDRKSSGTITIEFNNGTKLCTGKEKLKELNNTFTDASSLRITYNVYNAVYSAAHAIHDLYSCRPGEGPFNNGACADIHSFEPWELLHYVRNVHFRNKADMKLFFDNNGDPAPMYDILNWQPTPDGSLRYVKVGTFDFSAPSGQDVIISKSSIVWNGGQTQIPVSKCSESCLPGYRKATRRGQSICCFDCIRCSEGEITKQTDSTECLKCPDDHWSNEKRDTCIKKITEFLSYKESLGAALAAVSILCATVPAMVLCIFIKYRETPIVKANNRELSYCLLSALMLGFLCSLLFIGKPRRATCILRQTAFGVIFAFSVSCVLAKTIMVIIAFKATKPNSNLRKWVGPKLPNGIAFACTVIQVIICITWLAKSPPFPIENMKSHVGVIIIECNEGSTTTFWCVLGYMGLLAIVSFVVAFLARNLPDSFNETKFITFSMLVFVSVWLAFIPAYLSTRGKYMVAVEIFAILASSAGLLACIFFPKCYIILLRPDMNTREYLMGKGSH
uniref:G-protein coupled receptors family 3 profile domain-containing protein n=1 Tax=Latimeria chalumnae TaxID=7897 RepID=H3AJD4_LATCH